MSKASKDLSLFSSGDSWCFEFGCDQLRGCWWERFNNEETYGQGRVFLVGSVARETKVLMGVLKHFGRKDHSIRGAIC